MSCLVPVSARLRKKRKTSGKVDETGKVEVDRREGVIRLSWSSEEVDRLGI